MGARYSAGTAGPVVGGYGLRRKPRISFAGTSEGSERSARIGPVIRQLPGGAGNANGHQPGLRGTAAGQDPLHQLPQRLGLLGYGGSGSEAVPPVSDRRPGHVVQRQSVG